MSTCNTRSPERSSADQRARKKQRVAGEARSRVAKHVRLTKRIWWARHNHEQGKNLSLRVRAGNVEFNSFSQGDQTLAEDYEAGRSAARIKSLLEEREAAGSMNFHLLRLAS